jgi:hypothetical protein
LLTETDVYVDEKFVNVSEMVTDRFPRKYETIQGPRLTFRNVVLPTAMLLEVDTPMSQVVGIV